MTAASPSFCSTATSFWKLISVHTTAASGAHELPASNMCMLVIQPCFGTEPLIVCAARRTTCRLASRWSPSSTRLLQLLLLRTRRPQPVQRYDGMLHCSIHWVSSN